MNNKKGFTLFEVLMVATIIALLAALAVPSYLKTRRNAQHETAIAVLIEVANAARIYNEGLGHGQQTAGSLTDSGFALSVDYKNPVGALLSPYMSTGQSLIDRDILDADYTYKGYKYFVCNPDYSSAVQPAGPCKVPSRKAIAAMKAPDNGGEYANSEWWISSEDLGRVFSNLSAN
jgi:prepilin-type N-terminal cleavage/methylation domain-containing protein